MTKFIVRVDDVAQSLADPWRLDVGLNDFRHWWGAWEAGGDPNVPVYLAAVPHQLTEREIEILRLLEVGTGAEVCLHGWDHHPHNLQPYEVKLGLGMLPLVRCHVPPFNRYREDTIRAIRAATIAEMQPYLFGGLRENPAKKRPSDHPYGPAPRMVEGVVHLSAEWALYPGMVDDEALARIDTFPDPGYPVVLTLHAGWQTPPDVWAGDEAKRTEMLGGITALRCLLEGRIVDVGQAGAVALPWWPPR